MKAKLLLIISFIVFTHIMTIHANEESLTQLNSNIIYFGKSGKVVNNKQDSYIYRKLLKQYENNSCLVQDFYSTTDNKLSDAYNIDNIDNISKPKLLDNTINIIGSFTIWYENGLKKAEGKIIDGKLEGKYTKWHDNGQLALETTVKNGEPQGVLIEWNANGQKERESHYNNNSEVELVTEWYDNGHMKYQASANKTGLDGIERLWYDNGQLKHEAEYKNNKLNGVYRQWNKKGKLLRKEEYKDGEIIVNRKQEPSSTVKKEKNTVTEPKQTWEEYVEQRDREKEKNLLSKAKSGNTQAMYELGMMYHDGGEFNKDEKIAKEWFLQAAQKGHITSIHMMANFYDKTNNLYWYEKAANLGDVNGMFGLGVEYQAKGESQKAINWYKKAANKNFSGAMVQLGLIYIKGDGVTRDNKEALYWFKKAADLGNELGRDYYNHFSKQ